MSQTDRPTRIARAKELLATVKHAAMATVNAEGTPHNTPFMFLYAPDLSRVFWGSHPNSVHSRNVMRTGQVFIVLYEATKRGGLYIQAHDAHPLEGTKLVQALAVHNQVRDRNGLEPLTVDYYSGQSPQRMWSATPMQFWVNGSTRDKNDLIIEDIRQEVTPEELLS